MYAVKNNLLGWMIVGIKVLGTTPAFSAELWGGEGQLGFVLARGNSDADTVNAKLEMARETATWKNTFGVAALRVSSEAIVTPSDMQHRGKPIIALVRAAIGTVARAMRTIDLVGSIIKRAW